MVHWRSDPYPFILPNLAFSTQAGYAAPLILLAVGEVPTREHLRHELEDLRILLADLLPETRAKSRRGRGDRVERRAKKSG